VIKLAKHSLEHKQRNAEVHQNPLEQQELQALADNRQGAAGLPGGIVQLQRTIGNRAVAQMLQSGVGGGAAFSIQRAEGSGNPDVIRRRLLVHKPASSDDDEGGEVKMDIEEAKADEEQEAVEPSVEDPVVERGRERARAVDNVVEEAYTRFLGGDYTGASDAQIDLYKLRKYEFDTGNWTMHPSTAAGYVIEGMVNSVIQGWEDIQLQVTGLLSGTRPDVVIQLTDDQYALVDITASNSAGHILDKKGNWLNHVPIPVVAESIYPSIDFKTMGESKLSEEDMAAIQQRIAEQQEAQALAEEEARQAKIDRFKTIQNEIMEIIKNSDSEMVKRTIANSRFRNKFMMCGIKPDLQPLTFEEWNALNFSRSDVENSFKELGGKRF